jgi:hypothetical protein
MLQSAHKLHRHSRVGRYSQNVAIDTLATSQVESLSRFPDCCSRHSIYFVNPKLVVIPRMLQSTQKLHRHSRIGRDSQKVAIDTVATSQIESLSRFPDCCSRHTIYIAIPKLVAIPRLMQSTQKLHRHSRVGRFSLTDAVDTLATSPIESWSRCPD